MERNDNSRMFRNRSALGFRLRRCDCPDRESDLRAEFHNGTKPGKADNHLVLRSPSSEATSDASFFRL